jgi:ubiquinone/menaquinone biosynthesis C-methylase UbiE
MASVRIRNHRKPDKAAGRGQLRPAFYHAMTALYDRIGRSYDRSRKADPRIADRLAALLGPPDDGPVLDIGCGTGNYTGALTAKGYTITGLEISTEMLVKARRKFPDIEFIQGNAMSLPFADASFPRVLCTLAAHHFPDRTTAFREVRRVLSTGPFVLFTAFSEQVARYWLARYFPQAVARDQKQMPSEAVWREALAQAGFGPMKVFPWDVPEDLEDLFWYAGKFRPELYFDPEIRAGISAFANLAEEAEVQEGLSRLRADIDSGAFPEILAASRHDGGDYAFIAARPSR